MGGLKERRSIFRSERKVPSAVLIRLLEFGGGGGGLVILDIIVNLLFRVFRYLLFRNGADS